MPDPCQNCPGGDDHVHEVNPNWSETQVVREGSRVLIPRPLRPENICIQKTANVDVVSDPIVPDPDAEVFPIVWDPETCKFVRAAWPCPEIVDWDNTVEPAPADPCEECSKDGITRYAREINSGCISHMCVAGAWVCLGGGAPAPAGGEFVCYDLSAWSFPVSFSGGPATASQWDVFGSDVMDTSQWQCADGYTTFDNASVEFACWGDYGGYTHPGNGGFDDWNDLPWAPDTFSPGAPDSILAVGAPNESHGCSRPAFRIDPNFPIGSVGPIIWTFDMLQISGNTSFAAYDKITGQNLDILGFTQPAGPAQNVVNTPNGEILQTIAGPTGTYVVTFDLPSGVQAENVCFLAFNMGGSNGAAEEFTWLKNEIQISGDTCCFSWNNIVDVAFWLNQNDPNGLSWNVNGSCICAEAPVGVAGNYGDLAGCTESASPSVVEDPDDCP